MHKTPLLAFMGALLLSTSAFAQDEFSTVIGTVVAVEGGANMLVGGDAAKSVPVKPDMPIRIKDKIVTDKDGARVMMLMIDDTQFTLGDDTAFAVEEYVFKGDQPEGGGGRAKYDVSHGTFLYISGDMPKTKRPDVRIKFPYGEIGERAPIDRSVIWGGLVEDEFGEAYGVLADKGQVTVATNRGRIMMKEGMGTRLAGPNTTPNRPMEWTQDSKDEARMRVNLAERDKMRERIKEVKTATPDLVQKHRAMLISEDAHLPVANTLDSPRRHTNPPRDAALKAEDAAKKQQGITDFITPLDENRRVVTEKGAAPFEVKEEPTAARGLEERIPSLPDEDFIPPSEDAAPNPVPEELPEEMRAVPGVAQMSTEIEPPPADPVVSAPVKVEPVVTEDMPPAPPAMVKETETVTQTQTVTESITEAPTASATPETTTTTTQTVTQTVTETIPEAPPEVPQEMPAFEDTGASSGFGDEPAAAAPPVFAPLPPANTASQPAVQVIRPQIDHTPTMPNADQLQKAVPRRGAGSDEGLSERELELRRKREERRQKIESGEIPAPEKKEREPAQPGSKSAL